MSLYDRIIVEDKKGQKFQCIECDRTFTIPWPVMSMLKAQGKYPSTCKYCKGDIRPVRS